MSDCPACRKLGEGPASASFIAELPASLLLLGDHQVYPGYAVLWSKVHVKELHHLDAVAYAAFMQDLQKASAAVEKATRCCKLNTAILGNQVQHLHVHLFPRSAFDPERLQHPWVHSDSFDQPGTEQQRLAVIANLRAALDEA